MICINCDKNIIKCSNEMCNDYVITCFSCDYNRIFKKIDKVPDFTNDNTTLYWYQIMKKTHREKMFHRICCNNSLCKSKIIEKYNDNIPFISLMYSNIKINVDFDIKK